MVEKGGRIGMEIEKEFYSILSTQFVVPEVPNVGG